MQAYGILLVPKAPAGPKPALICVHGHQGTPEIVAGFLPEEVLKGNIYRVFGRMAVLGNYVVWCPMILGYYSEEHTPRAQGRDLLHKKALLSSRTLMGLEVAKLRRAVDYLSTLPEVDPRRIGIYGLSKGGHYLHALHGRPGEKAARGGGIRLVQRQDEKIDASEERRHTHALPHPH